MCEDFEILIGKLDKFIRKYYLNRIVKGLILTLIIFGLWCLIVSVAEYYGRFSSSFRLVLLISSVILYSFVFITMILLPLLKLFKIGKQISYVEAGKILGTYFPEIADKLQNTLELKTLLEQNTETRDLVYASINQRIEKLSPIPFLSAIKIKNNVKYLKFLLPIIFVFVVIFIVKPAIVTESTTRIVKYDQHFETPAPFRFIVENDSMIIKKGEDFDLLLKVKGDIVPDQVMINFGGNSFFMEKIDLETFKYSFKKLNNSLKFYFTAIDVESADYEIIVLPAPLILNFRVVINPLAYTGLSQVELNNTGDIEVPIGASVEWFFGTANLDSLSLIFDSLIVPAKKLKNEYFVKKQIKQSSDYELFVANEYFKELVDIKYNIKAIPDLYPTISVNSLVDSTKLSIVYYRGNIDDDYGFSNFSFVCIENDKEILRLPVPYSTQISMQDFYYAFDFSSLNIEKNKVNYYFEITDNDGFNGHKTTKSQMMEYSIPTSDEIQEKSSETNNETENKIEEARKISNDIKKSIDDLKKKLINENLSAYDRSQIMQQIIDDEMRLENLMDQIKQEQNQLLQYKEQFSKNEELVKKQEEINRMMENLMTDEMRKMLEEMQKLMENFDKEKFFKRADEMKFSVEDMERDMDNTLELLKKSEVEDRVKNIADQLDELSKKQEDLSKQTQEKNVSQTELQKKQEEQKQQYEKLKEEYKNTLEKNTELKDPMKLDDFKEEMDEISENFENSLDNLEQNKNGKASQGQQENSEKMQQLSEKMSSMMQESSAESAQENMEDVRQVLENVLTFSFEQESIMLQQKNVGFKSPEYKNLLLRQKNLSDNFSVIKDSLDAMAGRIPGLTAMISSDISRIRSKLAESLRSVDENRKTYLQITQQTIITSANNLALLLLELMDQMQQQQMSQMKSNSSCNNCKNKGQGQPKKQMGEMRSMQQSLKNQMQQMLDQMKKGENQPQNGQNGEQLAKMLMQQELMQKMMNDMMNGINPDAAKYIKEANRLMEENIKDVINGNVSQQTISRQERIITRLLQAENSENERETEQKRTSKEAKDYKLSNPDKAFKEKETEIRFNELLQFSNLKLKDYYKNRYKEYLKNLNE